MERTQKTRAATERGETIEEIDAAERNEELLDDTDALLGEIEELLETVEAFNNEANPACTWCGARPACEYGRP